MDEVKILYATYCQMMGAIKDHIKEADKAAGKILYDMDWDNANLHTVDLKNHALAIQLLAERMSACAESFMASGPYAGMDPGVTPLEAWAAK